MTPNRVPAGKASISPLEKAIDDYFDEYDELVEYNGLKEEAE